MSSTPSLSSNELRTSGLLDAIELYYERGWTDGLPVVPPTPERVAQTLAAAGLNPESIIGTVPTRNCEITAEKAAINSVMAGCLPEYFPVIAATLKAMCREDSSGDGPNAGNRGLPVRRPAKPDRDTGRRGPRGAGGESDGAGGRDPARPVVPANLRGFSRPLGVYRRSGRRLHA